MGTNEAGKNRTTESTVKLISDKIESYTNVALDPGSEVTVLHSCDVRICLHFPSE